MDECQQFTAFDQRAVIEAQVRGPSDVVINVLSVGVGLLLLQPSTRQAGEAALGVIMSWVHSIIPSQGNEIGKK